MHQSVVFLSRRGGLCTAFPNSSLCGCCDRLKNERAHGSSLLVVGSHEIANS